MKNDGASKRKLQILQASEQTEEAMWQIRILSLDIWQIDRERANNEKRITEITNIAKENDKELLAIAELKNKNMLLAAEDADTLRKKAAIEDRKQYLLKSENLKLEKQMNKLTLERTKLEIGGESSEEVLKVELKMLDEREQSLRRQLIILNLYNAKSDEIKQKTNEINALESERLQIIEHGTGEVRQYLLKSENLKLEKQMNKLTLERTKLEIGPKSPVEILKVELKMLDDRGQKLQRDLIILNLYNAKSDEIKQKTNEINALESERLQILERLRRAIDPMYDAYKRIEESVATTNQFISDLIVKGGTDVAQGIASIFDKAAGGFQDAQQEAENLKGTLAGLIQERDKILEDGIITDDEVDRFKELQTEISQTGDQISDLEDPIQNLKDSFKDFFKSVIDGIREMIAKWIAMKILTGIMGGFVNVGAGASIGTSSGYLQAVTGRMRV